jgi:hypothetical protein
MIYFRSLGRTEAKRSHNRMGMAELAQGLSDRNIRRQEYTTSDSDHGELHNQKNTRYKVHHVQQVPFREHQDNYRIAAESAFEISQVH